MSDRDQGAARNRLIGAQEAARFLGVHRSTLHAAVRQGVVVPDSRTPGGHMRFSRATLERFREHLTSCPATGDAASVAPIRAFAALAHHMVEPTGFEHICRTAISGIRPALPGIDMCVLAIRTADHSDQNRLHVVAQEGFPTWVFDEFHRLRKTLRYATTAALRSRQPDFCDDVDQRVLHAGTQRLARNLALGAYAVLPLSAGDESLGVLVCAAHQPRVFGEYDRAFLQGVADELAGALAGASERNRLLLAVQAGERLTSEALRLRLAPRDAAEPAHNDKRRAPSSAAKRMGDLFRELTGAAEVCALGFDADLPTRNPHLLALSCEACAGDSPVTDQWNENGTPYTGVAASAPLAPGRRAAVAAAWQGKRADTSADHGLLITFAGAYLLAIGMA